MSKLFIFDYDDTLFPSTDSANLIDKKLCKMLRGYLKKIMLTVSSYGKVIIVTRASLDWVKLTSEKYYKFDITEYIETYSVRDMYEDVLHQDKWKITFLTTYLLNKKYEEIYGFGDSLNDRESIMWFSHSHKVNNIKFLERPTILQLTESLKTVGDYLIEYLSSPNPLDVQIAINLPNKN